MFKEYLHPKDLVSAVKIAIVIGTLLNVINQGHLYFQPDGGEFNFWRAGLTYLVPFGVAVYSSARARRQCLNKLNDEPNE